MTFPTALKWEQEQFDTLVWQRTEWCQPIMKGILDGHFLLFSISHKVMTFIHMSCLILSAVLYSLLPFFLFMWFSFGYDPKEGFSCFPLPVLFINYPSSHDVLSYLQLRIVPTKENAIAEGNCLRKKNLEQIIQPSLIILLLLFLILNAADLEQLVKINEY